MIAAWKRVALATLIAAGPATLGAQGIPVAKDGPGDIVTVAAGAGSFNTLLAAVRAAGLEATLRGRGPFTVFAPTDAAFAKLPAGTVEALLADKAKLAAILTYHVVPGRVRAADVIRMGRGTPATVNGGALTVVARDGGVMVNDARVVQADVAASNGVIHAVDTVLMPPR